MYRYRALNRKRKQIRLLTVQPGSDDDILSCTLATTCLHTPIPRHYETISYVCGDQTIKATINLHGSKVQVPATSEAALRCMRLKDRARTLWIDSVCINQTDIDERGHQVGLMYEIYTRGSHNCIYLGPDDCDMLKVIGSMRAIQREMLAETRGYLDFGKMLFGPSGSTKLSNIPFSIDIKQSGLVEFFENPWFLRLWVVQEASLSCASTCYCGEHQLPLTEILRVAAWLSHKWKHMPMITYAQTRGLLNAMSIFDSADGTYGYHRRRNTMWDLLNTFDEFHTFDRKDQIYALVGLWQMYTRTSKLPAALTPDCSLSVPKVFSNASKFAIQEVGHLLLLRKVHVKAREKETAWWPSWLPVLDRRMGPDQVADLTTDTQTAAPAASRFWSRSSDDSIWCALSTCFAADGGLTMLLSNCNDGSNTLGVTGLQVDEVIEVTYIPAPLTASATLALMAALERPRPRSSWVENELAGDIETRAGLVLQAGSTRNVKRVTYITASRCYQNIRRCLKDHHCFPSAPMGPGATADERAFAFYAAAVSLAVPHRAVFHTKDGLMGLGPECARPGDIVAILYGCQWPAVLRPLPTPGEYEFLECAYVYGIMDGEAVHRHEEMGGKDRLFRIV
jgi:hypothetical protein